MDLHWISSRNIESQYMDISQLPIIQKSNAILMINEIETDGTLIDETILKEPESRHEVWIRLIFEPYIIPPSPGRESHKDIVLYVNPNNLDQAILAIQNPKKLTEWCIYTLDEYGQWLAREIDILLRMHAVM